MGLGLGLNLGLSNADESGGGAAPAEPLTPPEGMTGWLKLDDAEVGAFPSTANAGSVSHNWTRNGTDIVVATGGPNDMKVATLDAATTNDFLIGPSLADLMSVDGYMRGFIFKADELIASALNQYQVANIEYWSQGYAGTGLGSAGANKIVPWHWSSAEKPNPLDYTAGTWRVLVVRYDGDADIFYAKINGGSWVAVTSVTQLGSNLGSVRLLSRANVSDSASTHIAEWLCYATKMTEAGGDALGAYLCERSDLTW